MASVPRRLLKCTWRCTFRASAQFKAPKQIRQWPRALSATTPLRAKEPAKEGSATAAAAEAPTKVLEESTVSAAPESETAAELRKLVEDLKGLDPEVVQDAIRKGRRGIPFAQDFNLERDEDFEIREPEIQKLGFWAEGEAELGPDEDFYGDDLTSLGHGELEQHRELREYARLIAWELPLLNRESQPFRFYRSFA